MYCVDPGAVSVTTTQQASSRAGYTTYRVAVSFNARVMADVYALFGEAGASLVIPPAWQAAAPFGADVGPTNPAFFAVMPECEYDSFITIGTDGPALTPGAISTIGIDFGSWSESSGITSDNGAVFFMDPDHGSTGQTLSRGQLTVDFLQLTVRTGSTFAGQLSAQGRSVNDAAGRAREDWEKMVSSAKHAASFRRSFFPIHR